MILTVFLLLIALAGFLLWLGYAYEAWSFQLVGFLFFFVLGLLLNSGTVTYQAGYNESTEYIYGNNFTDYHWEYTNDPSAALTNDAYLFHTNTERLYTYEALDDEWALWVGRFLALASALSLVVFFFTLRGRPGE